MVFFSPLAMLHNLFDYWAICYQQNRITIFSRLSWFANFTPFLPLFLSLFFLSANLLVLFAWKIMRVRKSICFRMEYELFCSVWPSFRIQLGHHVNYTILCFLFSGARFRAYHLVFGVRLVVESNRHSRLLLVDPMPFGFNQQFVLSNAYGS